MTSGFYCQPYPYLPVSDGDFHIIFIRLFKTTFKISPQIPRYVHITDIPFLIFVGSVDTNSNNFNALEIPRSRKSSLYLPLPSAQTASQAATFSLSRRFLIGLVSITL